MDYQKLVDNAGLQSAGMVGLKSLSDPMVLSMLDYWKSKRNGRSMPRPSDMNPAQFARYMPNIMMLQVHRDPFDLSYRLLGEEVIHVHGFNLRGKSVHAANEHREHFGTMLFALYKYVADQCRPFGVGGTMDFVGRGYMSFEGVYMPLSEDGEQTDRIITCTAYRDDGGVSGRAKLAVQA